MEQQFEIDHKLIDELAKSIKSEKDLAALSKHLLKLTVERAMDAELDEQILALYARGMTTRDIAATFKEMYGAEVSHNLISKVTEAVIDEVNAWQNRPLETVYPILYLDCIVIKCHQDKRVIKKSIYLALAINCRGQKKLLGLWIPETEGSKFWLRC